MNAFKKDAEFYARPSWISNPASFFAPPLKSPDVTTKLVHGLKDGVVLDLEFASAYKVQNPDYAESHAAARENQTVYARMWQHDQPAKSTLIALHGWTMGDQRLNSLAFLPGMFYRFGIDVVLVELPYHGRRRPKGEDGAHLFPNSNLARTNESIAQIISDLRELKLFLEHRGSHQIGCVGMSLGAYISALWASLDELAFCIPIVPLVSLADIAWRLLKKEPIYKEVKKQGMNKELLERAYAVHCPFTHQPKIAPEKVLLLAGLGDTIVPRSQPRMLWHHWNNPNMHWFRGGHLAQFKSKRAMTRILRFLKENGFIG